MTSPFFFVDKKDGKLRPRQDYWYLNEHTVKNAYPLPMGRDIPGGYPGKGTPGMDMGMGFCTHHHHHTRTRHTCTHQAGLPSNIYINIFTMLLFF